MNLDYDPSLALNYKSFSQIARVLSESWCSRELYCAACDSDCLAPTKANNPAIDFTCPHCEEPYQLKSLKHWNTKKVVDAGYDAMISSIRSDRTPNLFILHYSQQLRVQNLLLIPRIFFSESAIEKRKPLRETAKRAGWIGCNILLNQIPPDGKIHLVTEGKVISAVTVRSEFIRVRGLAEVPPSLRGWTLDVLNMIRRLGKLEFSLAEVYSFEAKLNDIHPHNQNIRPKIRQQLQVLRDIGLIDFMGKAMYRLRDGR